MSKLTFDQENHEYRADGVVIPSVTQIIRAEGLSDFSKVPPDILAANSAFGTAVHRAIEYHIKGTLNEETLDDALKPYISAWDNFVDDFGYIHKVSEFQGFHPVYRYAYTIDLLGETTKGKFIGSCVGDIKAGAPKPADKIQLAGYKLAVPSEYQSIFILYLNPEFKPHGYKVLFSSNNKTEQGIFLSALSLFNFKKQEKLI